MKKILAYTGELLRPTKKGGSVIPSLPVVPEEGLPLAPSVCPSIPVTKSRSSSNASDVPVVLVDPLSPSRPTRRLSSSKAASFEEEVSWSVLHNGTFTALRDLTRTGAFQVGEDNIVDLLDPERIMARDVLTEEESRLEESQKAVVLEEKMEAILQKRRIALFASLAEFLLKAETPSNEQEQRAIIQTIDQIVETAGALNLSQSIIPSGFHQADHPERHLLSPWQISEDGQIKVLGVRDSQELSLSSAKVTLSAALEQAVTRGYQALAKYYLEGVTQLTQTLPVRTWNEAMAEIGIINIMQKATSSYEDQPAFFKPIYLKYLGFLSGYFYEQTTFNFSLNLIRESDGDIQRNRQVSLSESAKTFLLPIRNGRSSNMHTYFMRQFPVTLGAGSFEALKKIIRELKGVGIEVSFLESYKIIYDTTYGINMRL